MSIHTSTPVGAYRRFLCLYGVVNVKFDLIKNIQVYSNHILPLAKLQTINKIQMRLVF